MSIVSPKDSKRFYQKLISHKMKGAACFKDLLTINNILYKIYKEAVLALGLIKDDEHS